MLLSMTGHGAGSLQRDGVLVTAELRTVNNRYYKLSLRCTDGYLSLESRLDDLIRQSIRRGTVQLDLRIQRQSSPDSYRLNETALASYFNQLRAFGPDLGIPVEVRLESLLAVPIRAHCGRSPGPLRHHAEEHPSANLTR